MGSEATLRRKAQPTNHPPRRRVEIPPGHPLHDLQRQLGNRAVVSMMQRQDLLQRAPGKGIRSALGLKKASAGKQAESATSKALNTTVRSDSLYDHLKKGARLEKALQKVQKGLAKGRNDELYALAGNIRDAASKLLVELGSAPDEQGHQDQGELHQLQRVVSEAQLLLDRQSVAQTKGAALDAYATAGAGGQITNLWEKSGFQAGGGKDTSHLDGQTQSLGLGDTYAGAVQYWMTSTADYDESFAAMLKLQKLDPAAFEAVMHQLGDDARSAAGLHQGHYGAIRAFTSGDYKYMNPASSGSASWIESTAKDFDTNNLFKETSTLSIDQLEARAELVAAHATAQTQVRTDFRTAHKAKTGSWPSKPKGAPKVFGPQPKPSAKQTPLEAAQQSQVTGMRNDGALHTAVALDGLKRLPSWVGTAYRKDGFDQARFDKWFTGIEGKVVAKDRLFKWGSLTSSSKSQAVARGWTGRGATQVIFIMKLNNGRDVSLMSKSGHELEVALLPDAVIQIDKINVIQFNKVGLLKSPPDDSVSYELTIEAHQVR